jgi:hypothetical protein
MKPITLTEEGLLEKYGEIEVKFIYYYKYTFTFIGDFEGKTIQVSVGGSGDDIYRFEVEAEKQYKVKDLGVTSAGITENEQVIEEYYCAW